MELITVKELYKNREQYLDKEITVGGWVRSIRDSKTFGFIVSTGYERALHVVPPSVLCAIHAIVLDKPATDIAAMSFPLLLGSL